MKIGKVVGTTVLSVAQENLQGYKLLIVQPMGYDLVPRGEPFISVDSVGAGFGELVFMITSSESSIPFRPRIVPSDHCIVGIIDEIEYGRHTPVELEPRLSGTLNISGIQDLIKRREQAELAKGEGVNSGAVISAAMNSGKKSPSKKKSSDKSGSEKSSSGNGLKGSSAGARRGKGK
ncbi:MAG: hypothetical protein CVV64_18005 [Candidatus Wallbacteria bacterium HGW-Wallbacteria-1]|jgi:ethanolamine utilization protein EutN|uniref:Ethanolamine utilization protein EutN n=1 Tax=Candidatus Wallbacteria bacterium HGW-Wallbacteria-1 TaxID=2013854 RepID=A0A2N1PJX4_9BACT|nr:MAG: hypothetical protein CVV64_18005 [Candidatus Wallbacteria bacterium HGW-Wallbacteria-1]